MSIKIFFSFFTFLILCLNFAYADAQEGFLTSFDKAEINKNITNQTKTERAFSKKFDDMRDQYIEAMALYNDEKYDDVKKIRKNLKNYPLAIYIDYLLLLNGKEPVEKIKKFIEEKGHKTLSNRLKAYMIVKYAVNNDYKSLFVISPTEPKSDYLKCHWQRARYHTGEKKASLDFILTKYKNAMTLNKGCQNFVADLKQSKKITNDDVFNRLAEAYWTRNGTAIYKASARELKKSGYANAVKLLNSYYDSPQNYKKVPKNLKTTAALIFMRYARMHPRNALKAYDDFKKEFKISKKYQDKIEKVITSNLLYERYNVPTDFIDAHLEKYKDVSLYERRIRLAIWQKDYISVVKYIKKIPKSYQQKENYRYWLARGYENLNQKNKANEIYNKLSKERCFYCYLAADKVKAKYHIANAKYKRANSRNSLLSKYDSYARFSEAQLLNDADALKMEWFDLMEVASLQDARDIAMLEYDRGFEDLAIWETIIKQDWDNLRLRFPLLFKKSYEEQSKEQNVDITFLLGITRQESIMNPLARSPVGARGLMQIMPATAKAISKRNNYDYDGVETLYLPHINIKFGATYLRELLAQFNGNRIFASAGYNAGPNRALRWQSKDGIKRDVVTYIESIPFDETRNYVQKVIFYDFMYQYLLGRKELVLLTKEEMKANY